MIAEKTNHGHNVVVSASYGGKSGHYVRLDACFEMDTETVRYVLNCDDNLLEFWDFKIAARIYKNLSKRIEDETFTKDCLKRFLDSAKVFGLKVSEVR